MNIEGVCDARFERVRDAFARNFSERGDVGACFAATLEGETVVDIWGGHQDAARTRPWAEDTIVNVFSTTKTMTFLVALILADRGQLNLDAPVADYWPEFAANGKEGVLVKHLLAHSAGVPGFSRIFSVEEHYDWPLVCTDLASQAPWWPPGSQSGYHAFTQGYLIGEVVRRVTGSSFGACFKTEVADVVGADFHIGTGTTHFGRIAEMIPAATPAPLLEMGPDTIPGRVFSNMDVIGAANTPGWRQAEIPAANGHGNARSVVRAQTAMANGGRAFGKELLSAAGCRTALTEQTNGIDAVLGFHVRYGMGYAMGSDAVTMGPNPNLLWWGGAGGSTIVVDTDAHLCFSYVMNQMDNHILGDPRGMSLGEALYQSI